MRVRNVLLKVHLYLGLCAGLPLSFIAVTGSIIVFHDEIEAWLNPKLLNVTRQPRKQPLSKLVAAARAGYPGVPAMVIAVPDHPDRAYSVSLRNRVTVQVNPYTAEVLGTMDPTERFMIRVHRLHASLMAGKTGRTIVSIITMLSMLLSLTGIYLWWPFKIMSVRLGSRAKRINFDLHNSIGFYIFVFLFIISLTGVHIGFEKTIDQWVLKITGAPQPLRAPQLPAPPPGATPLPLDDLVGILEKTLPGARPRFIPVNPNPKVPFRVQMKFPEDHTPGGRSLIYLDQYTGNVLQVDNSREAAVGTYVNKFKEAIHTGDILGAPTAWIAFLVCLALPVQFVTGFLIWWRRPRSS